MFRFDPSDGSLVPVVIDVEGNLWSSSLSGIQVFTQGGQKIGDLSVPEKVANCCMAAGYGGR